MSNAEQKQVRVGFIGTGNFMQFQHLPNCKLNPRIHIRALCRRDPAQLPALVEEYKPDYTSTNYEELLKDPEIDLIFIGVRSDLHTKFVEEAASAGKNIFVEKPMSMTRDENYQIIKSIRNYGVKLCVGYNRRYAPAMQDAKDVHDRQKANPVYPEWRLTKPKGTEFKESGISMMMCRLNDDSGQWRIWPFDEKIGGGRMVSEGCHFMDLMTYFIGQEPVEIYAMGYQRDNHTILVRYEDGSIGTYIGHGLGSTEFPKELVEIYVRNVTLQIGNYVELRGAGIVDWEDKFYSLQYDSAPEIKEQGLEGYRLRDAKRKWDVYKNKSSIFLWPRKGHYELVDRYVDSILNGTPSPCSEIDGARATVMVLKAIESARSGHPVRIARDEYDPVVYLEKLENTMIDAKGKEIENPYKGINLRV